MISEPDTTSRSKLAGSAYKDDRHLSARQSLYAWQTPSYDLPGIVLDHLPVAAERVLDVGCGNGKFLTRIRRGRPDISVVGLDISAGILAPVAPPVAVADAVGLPIASRRIDVVLAMHMLYHVSDLRAALREIDRVLVPGGLVIASTNARSDKGELDELWSSAAADVLGIEHGPRRVALSDRFTLEDAPKLLASHFSEIEVLDLPGVIAVTDPDPVVAHLASYRSWADEGGVPFDATLERAREILTKQIEETGEFRITCRGGVILCRHST